LKNGFNSLRRQKMGRKLGWALAKFRGCLSRELRGRCPHPRAPGALALSLDGERDLGREREGIRKERARARGERCAPRTEPSFREKVRRVAGCPEPVANSNDLIQRKLDNSYGARFEQFGKQLAHRVLTDHGLDRDPFLAFQVRTRIELRHRWRGDRRQ
jgi:hypothetical protein